MNVLIKGMDMPTLPALREKEGKVVYKACVVVEKGKTPKLLVNMQHSLVNTDLKAYELEEVSTPHGRLIDADKFLEWLHEFYPQQTGIMSGIKNARTIIEAEE